MGSGGSRAPGFRAITGRADVMLDVPGQRAATLCDLNTDCEVQLERAPRCRSRFDAGPDGIPGDCRYDHPGTGRRSSAVPPPSHPSANLIPARGSSVPERPPSLRFDVSLQRVILFGGAEPVAWVWTGDDRTPDPRHSTGADLRHT